MYCCFKQKKKKVHPNLKAETPDGGDTSGKTLEESKALPENPQEVGERLDGFTKDLMLLFFEKVPEQKYSKMELSSCVVCFELFKRDGLVTIIPECGHAFHKKCLMHWWRRRMELKLHCPVCKNEVNVVSSAAKPTRGVSNFNGLAPDVVE